MNRTVTVLSIAVAFAAGCGVTHFLLPAFAADTIAAQVIHTGELEGDALSPANPSGMRNKLFVGLDGITIAIPEIILAFILMKGLNSTYGASTRCLSRLEPIPGTKAEPSSRSSPGCSPGC